MILKAVISGLIIAGASEVARRSPAIGGLVLSLPLISVLTFIWMWRETGDREMIANLSDSIFLYFLPTLPLFLVFPMLLRAGIGFPVALSLGVVLTALLYGALLLLSPHLGLRA
ncbi:MAG TPA: DUF3147 family protein [Sphingomicrobium sp.]